MAPMRSASPSRANPASYFPAAHRLAQRFHVRLDRFGVHAAEKGIARAANLVRLDSVPVKQFAQQSAPGAVHRIDYKSEFRRAQPVPIDQLGDRLQIRLVNFKRMN